MLPLAFTHVHLASALFYNTDHAWVLNHSSELLSQLVDLLHAALLLKLNAHLDFESEHLKQQVPLAHVVSVRVAGLSTGHLQLCYHIFEAVELFGVEVDLAQIQRSGEPKSLVRGFEVAQDQFVHLFGFLGSFTQVLRDCVLDVVDGLSQIILADRWSLRVAEQSLCVLNHFVILTKLHGEDHNVPQRIEAMRGGAATLLHHDHHFELLKRA